MGWHVDGMSYPSSIPELCSCRDKTTQRVLHSLLCSPLTGDGWPLSVCHCSHCPTEFFTFCSFEEDLCSWEVEAGQPTWERNTSVGLGTTSGVPTRDHSTNSATGVCWQWVRHASHHPFSFCLCAHVPSPAQSHLGVSSGYFLHTIAGGAVSVARLSSPTFQATNSCSVSHYGPLCAGQGTAAPRAWWG